MASTKVSTNRKNYFSWSRAKVDVLKLDHYFFNKNSALFLPIKLPDQDRPDEIAKAALAVLGIKSLATVFAHCEADGRLRAIIAGHADDTDDEGGVEGRYALSKSRAESVHRLLAGDRQAWAKCVVDKHQVEDYQLLLRYLDRNKQLYFGKWKDKVKPLDPGKADNSWNAATEQATRNFVVGFNVYAPTRDVDKLKLSEIIKKIKADDKKRWPEEMWRAIYTLYENAIARTLGLKTMGELAAKREKILAFCDDTKPCVACGESVPLEELNDQGKSDYSPKPGRGVEILFFDAKNTPGKKSRKKMRIVCPAEVDRVHEPKECPIFYKYHLKTSYIDHRNIDLAIYHLKFVYFDRVLGDITPVPEGLTIEVSCTNASTNVKELIEAVVDFNDGVYTVKVPADKKRKNITFWFKAIDGADDTKRLWVFTKDADSAPELVSKTDVEIAALSVGERLKYYDLPKEWSSRNYWTRFDRFKTGKRYQDQMKGRKFEPYGTKKMTASKPLIFCLDDIVLTRDAGQQVIRDKTDDNSSVDLSKYSRVTLLYADADDDDDFQIRIHKPKEKESYFSDVDGGFFENLIHDHIYDASDTVHPPCRAVVFCNDFYDVYHRRTEREPQFDFDKGHILGGRAARVHDGACSGTKACSGWNGGDKTAAYVCDGAGNYELHYLHGWGVHDNKLQSGLILYWNCRFTVDATKGGKKVDKKNYIEQGMQNAMDRINLKKYQLERKTGAKDIVIKTFALLEAKLDYKSGGTSYKRGGKHRCMVTLTNDDVTSGMGDDTANFRSSAYKDEPDRPSANPAFNDTPDYDGHSYASLTGAHELGHALGLDDEYIRVGGSGVRLAQYNQYYPGVPYSKDMLSLMNKNRATRMHQFWLYANWINDAGEGGALDGLLDSTKFQIALRGEGFDALQFEQLQNEDRNIYVPRWNEDLDFGSGAEAKLIVYKLGDGEFANTLQNGSKFTGIMVIRSNIRISWAHDTENWTGQDHVDWVQALDSDLKLMLNDRYWLKSDDEDNDFAKVYMYFLPHYSRDDPAPGGTHFNVHVKKNSNDGFHPDPVDKSKIEVDDGVDNKKIIRHFFGQFAGTTNLSAVELGGIKDWIGHNTRADDTFSIEGL